MQSLTIANTPHFWERVFPFPQEDDHKFDRGYALFWGSADLTGAIQLATRAARRVGVGLIGVVSQKSEQCPYSQEPGLLTFVPSHAAYRQQMRLFLRRASDPRVTAISLGSGLSQSAFLNHFEQRDLLKLLHLNKPLILDGGAIHPIWFMLAQSLQNVIFTPHGGEARRLFSIRNDTELGLKDWQEKIEKVQATIILKGPKTLVVADQHPLVRLEEAPSSLASAGTGDILTGIVTAFVAQKMPLFEAATAGVWVHAECAKRTQGPLIAEDLLLQIQPVIASLR